MKLKPVNDIRIYLSTHPPNSILRRLPGMFPECFVFFELEKIMVVSGFFLLIISPKNAIEIKQINR